jgi:hypothetical protein
MKNVWIWGKILVIVTPLLLSVVFTYKTERIKAVRAKITVFEYLAI